jgi:hypothetical protein
VRSLALGYPCSTTGLSLGVNTDFRRYDRGEKNVRQRRRVFVFPVALYPSMPTQKFTSSFPQWREFILNRALLLGIDTGFDRYDRGENAR